MLRLIAVLFLSAALCSVSEGQINQQAFGIPQNASLIQIPLGFINPLSGQVHLELPLVSLPTRSAAGPFVASMVYDTNYIFFNGGTSSYSGNDGWQLQTGMRTSGFFTYDSVSESCPDPGYSYGEQWKYSNFRLIDLRGTVHILVMAVLSYTTSAQTCKDNKTQIPEVRIMPPATLLTDRAIISTYTPQLAITPMPKFGVRTALWSGIRWGEADQTSSGIAMGILEQEFTPVSRSRLVPLTDRVRLMQRGTCTSKHPMERNRLIPSLVSPRVSRNRDIPRELFT